nr:dna topoisomerase 2 [Quercus suber]
MAQDYVGSNNINLLQPNGQFGTRKGGKDHAIARYVHTPLSPIMRFLFHKDDDDLLDYLNEDRQSIEPTWRLLNGDAMEPMDPWYKWFKGTIEKTAAKEGGNSYTICGTIELVHDMTLRITELPICRWTQDYKEFLESISSSNKECKDPFIEDFDMNCDDVTVEFDVFLTPENLIRVMQDSEIEVVVAPEAKKKGGGKPAANVKAVKAPAAAKKIENKVRRMRASPFNKKSGSVLGRVGKVNEVTKNEENLGSASNSASSEETIEVAPARGRPQRVNRTQTRYVLSDSESEHATKDFEFDEVTDESEDE